MCSVCHTIGQICRWYSFFLYSQALTTHQGMVIEQFCIHSLHRRCQGIFCSRSGTQSPPHQIHTQLQHTYLGAGLVDSTAFPSATTVAATRSQPSPNVPRFNLDGYLSVPVGSLGPVSRRERANESALRDTIHRSTGLYLCVRPNYWVLPRLCPNYWVLPCFTPISGFDASKCLGSLSAEDAPWRIDFN